ncbi:ATP-binding cassette sub-family A member 2 [Strongyloides ratti]|uniref:ATP-binding cassette sub-family A member 2 n=1 Tax=Strongyloides ratti TaxID=34506 RepID=A0A090L8Z1_STRRB|nr:ATP-binding cassette sub-family A member 2 [Strongyloides ratti]CEF64618.1 ATP-binding cassette sub-family A member 2 [Strongyloides ratti]
MIVNRHNYLYTNKNNNEQNILGYLETKNYTVYWSSNNNNDNELDNLTENLIYANSKLGKLFQQEVSFPKIKLKYFDNKSILEDELNSCKKNFFGSCSNILFGLYIVYNSNENKKNYTIYLFDKEKKENNYLLGNIKYSTMLTLLQKNMTKNNFNNIPYIFIYDVSKAESMSYNFIENSRQFLYMNYCYQLFSTIFIIASVNNIVKQRNGMLKKYLHDIGVSRFIFFGSCILRPLIEMIIFFCISGSILLSWWLPELNISLFNFTIWKILYSLGAMGFGVILTSLCDGKKDILITIIFWLMFIHLDIGEVVGLTSYNILSVLNINVIDNNLARLQTIPLYYDMKNKTKHFPLELNYKNEFFDTFEFQFIWLFMNMFFCYGFGIIVDNLWPNDSYNQFSFLYYIRLLRNYGYVRHILDKDDYHDLNKAIRSTDTKKKNTIKNEVTNNSKYKKKIIVGKHITKIYKATGETALEDVNFIFKSNEINVIIGFNESGLGTLMEILAGASKPSKGRVTYFNKSLKNFGRHKIGYCPHYTVTYTGMTVEMAIKVFSIIKNNEYRGLNNIKNEYLFMNYDVELLVETLGLTDYMDINCEHLPEKIQIYLNLCMAFVGNPRIIILNGILDKLPSEDVVKIISILKDMKEVKTIIVSTQDMEIADQLADHILLMKRGKVVDRGPFEELKKIHCSYAKLDIRLRRSLISDDGNLTTLYNTIHDFVKTFISEVVIEEGQSYGNHLVLKLPQDTKYNFGKLLDSLESNAETLNIIDYNINSFSLEDSFLLSNIGATLEPHLQKNIDLINRIPGFDDRVSGYTLYTKQLFALIKKRFSYMLIDIKTIFFVVIMTILLTTSLSQFFKNYSTNVCLLNENRTTFKQNYIPMYVSNKKEEDILDINNNIKKIGNSFIKLKKIPQNYKFWEEKFPLKISPNISNYQSIITTSLCLNFSLSFMDSLINFHSKTNNDNIKSNVIYLKKNFTINKEIDSNSALVMKFLTKKFDINWNIFIPTSQIIMMCIVTYFLTAYPLLIERIKGFKQQQYYSGVSPFLYWISNFIADIILGIIILSLLITLFGVLDVDSSFIPFFQATCIYFFMNLPVFYCLTFFGKNFIENCGLIGIFIITFQGLLYIFFGKNIITKQDHDEKNAKYLWEMLKTYMNPFVYLYNVKLAQQYGNENDKINASYFMNHGLGLFIGFLYIILIFGILILMECGVIVSIRNWIGRLKVLINNNNNPRNRRRRKDYEFTKTTTTEGSTDSNSANSDESCHVSTIRPEDKPTIILENAKPYLRDINLQMKLNADVFPGECFCWYIKDDKEREGIFNFMTGNIKKKEGFITINDKNVNSHMRMGYSPSKNVLLPFFTPFEHYKLFALLSGFRKSKLQAINMLNLTGLIQYRHKQIQYCDLNQKRRLVVGISALTQSGAIFLDSPTEYLYKQGRIEIWELINSLLIEKDEAIIITTNNLEECNELSSRFGIIENGYIDYNGTYVGLKKKYCDGYNFKITVSNPSLEVLICLDQIMVREFEAIPADLTKITSLMEWDIPKITNEGKLLSWSDMYTFGEKLFLRYGKLVLPTQYSEKNSSKQNFNKFDLSTTDTASTTSEESRLLEEGFHDDEDDDDKADKVLGYGGIRSNITVPHIIDYIITNNSLDQVIFKIQNSNL